MQQANFFFLAAFHLLSFPLLAIPKGVVLSLDPEKVQGAVNAFVNVSSMQPSQNEEKFSAVFGKKSFSEGVETPIHRKLNDLKALGSSWKVGQTMWITDLNMKSTPVSLKELTAHLNGFNSGIALVLAPLKESLPKWVAPPSLGIIHLLLHDEPLPATGKKWSSTNLDKKTSQILAAIARAKFPDLFKEKNKEHNENFDTEDDFPRSFKFKAAEIELAILRLRDVTLDGEFRAWKNLFFVKRNGEWTLHQETNHYWLNPFPDVTGDGIPEFGGGNGYQGYGIFSVFPDLQNLYSYNSGV